jgi:predicted O-methyltransferase YrrM
MMLADIKKVINRSFTLNWHRFRDEVVLRRQWQQFYLVFGGHIFFQTLRTAVKLDLFTLLEDEGPMTRSDIQQRLGIEEQPARILLLGCAAAGLLRKQGDRYSNTVLARQLLVKDSPGNVSAYIELQHQAMYKAMPWMYESVMENRNVGLQEFEGGEPTFYQRLAHYPELEKVFQEAMQELSAHANGLLARYVDFSGVAYVVDVGGGDGSNLIQLARQWPHLRGTVFDSPTVCEIARQHIAEAGLSDRIDTSPGDCFDDPFPQNADCFLFAHFFTIWSKESDCAILKKTFDALPSGGKVLIFNMMQDDDETGPLSAAVGSPYFLTLATGSGMLYTWQEYESWIRDAGFVNVVRQSLPRDHGVVIGTKP